MKRIVGRKMVEDQTTTYGSYKLVPKDPRNIIVGNQLFRFRWTSDIIDILRQNGSMCYNYLDIGSYTGELPVIVAKKSLNNNPDVESKETICVDAIELHKESFDSLSETARMAREMGLKLTAHNVKFEDFQTDKTYDMITAFEVIEHMRDPMFSIEKMYDMLEIGGHLLITVPEESGIFGLRDKNPFHYWVSTVQSLVFFFNDDKKWRILQVFVESDIIHMQLQKKTYQM